jgi:Family of unknown function (DUF6530)
MPQLEFPDQILHTPVYVVPYFAHDPGQEGNTDAQFLSVGWSQWDDEEPAAKVVRHSGQRWSRQSEELPLGRLVDLVILTALAFGKGRDFVQIDGGVFESQVDPIAVAHGSKRDRIALVEQLKSDKTLRRRFQKLYSILQEIDSEGGFQDA